MGPNGHMRVAHMASSARCALSRSLFFTFPFVISRWLKLTLGKSQGRCSHSRTLPIFTGTMREHLVHHFQCHQGVIVAGVRRGILNWLFIARCVICGKHLSRERENVPTTCLPGFIKPIQMYRKYVFMLIVITGKLVLLIIPS